MQALPRLGTGLLLHASGIVLDGAGYVFTGASGRGKTTVSRLAAGRAEVGRTEVLTDENVIIRLGAAGPSCAAPRSGATARRPSSSTASTAARPWRPSASWSTRPTSGSIRWDRRKRSWRC